MRQHQDGRGEGYGKYSGLSVSETQAIFDKCVVDPSMRSISAVLRITREQLEARGNLGVYPVFAWVSGVFCAIGVVAWLSAPPNFKELAIKVVLGSASVFAMLLITVLSTLKARRRNVSQEAALRDAAVAAIVEILKSNPPLKPLTMEQDYTVKLLIRKSPDAKPLSVLLDHLPSG